MPTPNFEAVALPREGVTRLGEFESTTLPVPVEVTTPVPPLATATTPVTLVALSVGVSKRTQEEEVLISNPFVVVLKMTNPVAGLAMLSLSEVVILGGKNPCEEELISSFAEAEGLDVPIPTCAKEDKSKKNNTRIKLENTFFFIADGLIYLKSPPWYVHERGFTSAN